MGLYDDKGLPGLQGHVYCRRSARGGGLNPRLGWTRNRIKYANKYAECYTAGPLIAFDVAKVKQTAVSRQVWRVE